MYDVVMISGGFDPPHVGHIRMALESAKIGKKVIVGVNSDDWLTRKKGYVFMPWAERAELMEAVKGVDKCLDFDDSDNTAIDLIRKVRELYPNDSVAFANGGDRITDNTPEKSFCESVGVEMVWEVGGGKIQSSSDLVKASMFAKKHLKESG
mgnify:CR=1 FL=1